MRKILRRLLMALAAIAMLFVLGTLVPRPLFPAEADDALPTRRVLLLSNPIHTDIAIPIDPGVLVRFSSLVRSGIQADLPEARYLVFGWGGREFYLNTPTWSELKAGPLLKGLTLDRSVMHVDVNGAIDEDLPYVTAFDLTEAEFGRMLDFIALSFQQGPDGPIRIADVAYGQYDGFFEANGSFTALLGCNTWTARVLREAGLRTGWWNPLPQTLAMSVSLYN